MAGIEFRWDPLTVEFLLDLEDAGLTHHAEAIVEATEDRLSKQPGIYRFVEIAGVGSVRSRRLTRVQRLFLGSRLPYIVYYRYFEADKIVEILRVRHVRQKPLERR